jgi:hypothetical protein
VIVGVVGFGLTVTDVAAEVALQPLALVTVTLKLPEAVTLMDCVVAPFDHAYVYPMGAVSVTLPPAQNVVGPPAVTAGVVGFGLTVTDVAALLAAQPFVLVTVTL